MRPNEAHAACEACDALGKPLLPGKAFLLARTLFDQRFDVALDDGAANVIRSPGLCHEASLPHSALTAEESAKFCFRFR